MKRTSLNLDLDLVAAARNVLSTRGTTDTVHAALREVVRRKRLESLIERRWDDLTPEKLEELRRWRTAEPEKRWPGL